MRRGSAALHIGRPLGEISAPENRVGRKTCYTVRDDQMSRADSSSPGPCIWRLASFVVARHSTFDTSLLLWPISMYGNPGENQIKS